MCKGTNAFEATVSRLVGHLEGPVIVDEGLCCLDLCLNNKKGPIKNIFLSHVEFIAVKL